jgi:hypothetical protein
LRGATDMALGDYRHYHAHVSAPHYAPAIGA